MTSAKEDGTSRVSYVYRAACLRAFCLNALVESECVLFLDLKVSKSPFSVCPYHFPCALPHRHCHPASSSRSCPQAGGGRPAGGPKSSCCWASPTRPGHCRSSSAAIPAGEGPGAGSPPRRSLGETATRETKRLGVTIKRTLWVFLID